LGAEPGELHHGTVPHTHGLTGLTYLDPRLSPSELEDGEGKVQVHCQIGANGSALTPFSRRQPERFQLPSLGLRGAERREPGQHGKLKLTLPAAVSVGRS
jgi:hypothetical protein